jgi:predicted patatin/cPLA2 family phospholipase
VIRTRPGGTSQVPPRDVWLASRPVRRCPNLVRAIRDRGAVYAGSTAFISDPPRDCRIVQVAPPQPLRTSRTSRDQRGLAADYALGMSLAGTAISRWRNIGL